jgi:hypothetical protein
MAGSGPVFICRDALRRRYKRMPYMALARRLTRPIVRPMPRFVRAEGVRVSLSAIVLWDDALEVVGGGWAVKSLDGAWSTPAPEEVPPSVGDAVSVKWLAEDGSTDAELGAIDSGVRVVSAFLLEDAIKVVMGVPGAVFMFWIEDRAGDAGSETDVADGELVVVSGDEAAVWLLAADESLTVRPGVNGCVAKFVRSDSAQRICMAGPTMTCTPAALALWMNPQTPPRKSLVSVVQVMDVGTQYATVSVAATAGKPWFVRVVVSPQPGPTANPAGQMAGE